MTVVVVRVQVPPGVLLRSIRFRSIRQPTSGFVLRCTLEKNNLPIRVIYIHFFSWFISCFSILFPVFYLYIYRMKTTHYDYDFVIIGSGFGGSVSALRLSEKGYKVLVIEKGRWFKKGNDFAKTNWNFKKWLWAPALGLKGIMRISLFKHVTVLSGVGVGGGSLVYANTLPIPSKSFFESPSWSDLADWEDELAPHYQTARTMLGATQHPYHSKSEKAMSTLAEELGKKDAFEKPHLAIYFGKPGETVEDPYFDGKGPDRTGCILCGACMTGCRHNSKNTLDKNYLYLAQIHGAEILAEREVVDVAPINGDGSEGYIITHQSSLSWVKNKQTIRTQAVIFSAGVMGTLSLLTHLKQKSLPLLSNMLGKRVRTNSESLIGVVSYDRQTDYSEGVAIGSLLHIDERRNLEPVRYGAGSGFWRMLVAPLTGAGSTLGRIAGIIGDWLIHPIDNIRVLFTDDFAKRSLVLLYMETIDSTIRLVKSPFGKLATQLEEGPAPTARNPMAFDLARRMASIMKGKAMVVVSEALFGIPTTAHILGGACMGKNDKDGVIDADHRVFNYQNMWICDGSAISANPGVNPSLTITALTERAMSKINPKTI